MPLTRQPAELAKVSIRRLFNLRWNIYSCDSMSIRVTRNVLLKDKALAVPYMAQERKRL